MHASRLPAPRAPFPTEIWLRQVRLPELRRRRLRHLRQVVDGGPFGFQTDLDVGSCSGTQIAGQRDGRLQRHCATRPRVGGDGCRQARDDLRGIRLDPPYPLWAHSMCEGDQRDRRPRRGGRRAGPGTRRAHLARASSRRSGSRSRTGPRSTGGRRRATPRDCLTWQRRRRRRAPRRRFRPRPARSDRQPPRT
jgi:hypothetical protein